MNISSKQAAQTYYTNYINYTAQTDGRIFRYFTEPYNTNHIVLYISALWIAASFRSGSTYYPIKMHIYTGIVNSTHYYWNLTLSTQVRITNIHFSQVIYNSADVQSS